MLGLEGFCTLAMAYHVIITALGAWMGQRKGIVGLKEAEASYKARIDNRA
jgi:hypothetical protein